MRKFVSNVFGSLALKISGTLLAMGAMTAIAVFIGVSVFHSLSRPLNELLKTQLPGIQDSQTVIGYTGDIQTAVSDILMAKDPGDLQMGAEDLELQIITLLDAMENLPPETVAEIEELLQGLEQAAKEMQTALGENFARSKTLREELAAFTQLAEETRDLLAQLSDDAVYDMNLAGDQTIAVVSDTLSGMIEYDFAAITQILKARGEINLLSGVVLALSVTDDATFVSRLRETGGTALTNLEASLAALDENNSIPDQLPILQETAQGFRDALMASFRSGAAYRDNVMALRETSTGAINTAIDELTETLKYGAEDAATFNSDAIHRLFENEVQQMRDADAVALAVETLTSIAYLGATARDHDEAEDAQMRLDATASWIRSLKEDAFLNDDVIEKLDRLLPIADPETGVVATRTAMLDAQMTAEATSYAATAWLRRIASAAVIHADTMVEEAAAAGDAILHEAAAAERKLNMIGTGTLVLFLIAPVFTWLLVIWPLSRLTRVTNRLAHGDLAEIKGFRLLGGEIARMAEALVIFRDGLIEREKMEKERQAVEIERQERAAEQHIVVSGLAEALQALSKGDLTRSLEDAFPEDYEALRRDFNATIDTLNDLMGTVVENATEIHTRAEEINSASDDLSQRTENQAATLEETAAALDELTSSVRAAADGAAEVEKVVKEARADAENSGRVVTEAIGAMSEIKKSSDEINQIIGVIDDIAFQTNLLALNAGVEAARAGEAGRGFAVVASEVRALAQRSSDAAKEIKQLISTSSDHVESGVSLVNRTGEALTDIVERVANIAELITGIATGAREQSSGIGEINVGVTQLDKVTQQNAAMVEEATAASTTLKHEADNLHSVVGRFALKGRGSTRTDMAGLPVSSFEDAPAVALAEPEPMKMAANDSVWQDF